MTTAPADSSGTGTGTGTGTISAPSGGTVSGGEILLAGRHRRLLPAVAIVDGTHLCLLPASAAAGVTASGPTGVGGHDSSGVDGGGKSASEVRSTLRVAAVPIRGIPELLPIVSRPSSKIDEGDGGVEEGVKDDEKDDHSREEKSLDDIRDSVEVIELEMDTACFEANVGDHDRYDENGVVVRAGVWGDDGAVVDTGSSVVEFAHTLLRRVEGETTDTRRPGAVCAFVGEGGGGSSEGILIHRPPAYCETPSRGRPGVIVEGGDGGQRRCRRRERKRRRLTIRGGDEDEGAPPRREGLPTLLLSWPPPPPSAPFGCFPSPPPSPPGPRARVDVEAEGVGSFLVADFFGNGLDQVLLLPRIPLDACCPSAVAEGGTDTAPRDHIRERRERERYDTLLLARILRRAVLTDGRDVWYRSRSDLLDPPRDHRGDDDDDDADDGDGDGDDADGRGRGEGHHPPSGKFPGGGPPTNDDDGEDVRRIRLEPLSSSSGSNTIIGRNMGMKRRRHDLLSTTEDRRGESDAPGVEEDPSKDGEGGDLDVEAEEVEGVAAAAGTTAKGDGEEGDEDEEEDDGTAMALAKVERGLRARLVAERRAADDADALRRVRWRDVDHARDVAYALANSGGGGSLGGGDNDAIDDAYDGREAPSGLTFLPVFGDHESESSPATNGRGKKKSGKAPLRHRQGASSNDGKGEVRGTAAGTTKEREAISSSSCLRGYPLEMVRLRWRSLPAGGGGGGGGGNVVEIEVDVLARERRGRVRTDEDGLARTTRRDLEEEGATNAMGKDGRKSGNRGDDHDDGDEGKKPPPLSNVFLSCSQRRVGDGGRRRGITTRSGVVPVLQPGQCATIMASVEGISFPFGHDYDYDDDADVDTVTVCMDAMWSQRGACAAGGRGGDGDGAGIGRSSRRGGMALGELRLPLEGVALPSRRFRTIEFVDCASHPSPEAVFEYREPRVMRLSPADYRDAVIGRDQGDFWRRLSQAASGGGGEGGGRIELDPDSSAIVVFGDTPERRSDLVRLVLKFLPDSVRLVWGVDRGTTGDGGGGLRARAQDLVSSISNEIETMMAHRAVPIEKLRTSLVRNLASLQAVTDDVAADLIIRRGNA